VHLRIIQQLTVLHTGKLVKVITGNTKTVELQNKQEHQIVLEIGKNNYL